jgi:hypothetical protein
MMMTTKTMTGMMRVNGDDHGDDVDNYNHDEHLDHGNQIYNQHDHSTLA